jgi:hypothetical protein
MTASPRALLGALAVVAGAIAAPAPAPAALVAKEQALELPLAKVRLPVADTGALVVRRCARCQPEVLRLTPATLWFVRLGTAAVTPREARKAAAGAAGRSAALVYVFYEPGSRAVRRLVLDPGP